MFKRFTAPLIDTPFIIYCDDYSDKKVRKHKFAEVQFSGDFAKGICGEYNFNNVFPLESIVKITYTYYDWLKKKRVNQIIYKR